MTQILPIGTVIESEDKKYIIIGYEMKHHSYLAAGYPSYYLADLIPAKKEKEFKKKYKHYNIDDFIPFDTPFQIIYMGYQNEDYYRLEKELEAQ